MQKIRIRRNSFEMKAHDAQFQTQKSPLQELKDLLAEPMFREDGKFNI